MRKFFITILCILFAQPCFSGVNQVYPNSLLNGSSGGGTVYFQVDGVTQNSHSGTEADVDQIVSASGNFKNLLFYGPSTDAGESVTATFRVNGVDTGLTCTYSGAGGTNCSDTSNSAAVSPGDMVSIKQTTSGTFSGTVVMWSINFQGSVTAESNYSAGHTDDLNTTATEYNNLHGKSTWTSTEAAKKFLIPTPGTLKNFYVKLTASPGASKSYTFTIMKNGSACGSLAATVSGAATTANDTSNTCTVVAGDYITVQSVPSGTPSLADANYGITFLADTDGYFIINTQVGTNAASSVYNGVNCSSQSGSTSNNARVTKTNSFTGKDHYVLFDTAPGAGKSYTIDRETATDRVTISDTNTSGNTTADLSYVQSANYEVVTAPTGTPSTSNVYSAVAGYNTPTVTSRRRTLLIN